MLYFSRRVVSSTGVWMGLSILCGMASGAQASAEVTSRRVTPTGGLFSIEFPSAPTCDATGEVPDCRYEDPTEGWILRASYQQVERSSPPAEYLQKQLSENAEAGGFQIDHQEPTQVGGFPALDYRFESMDGAAYRSMGRLVLVGTQLVDIEVGGDTLPSEEVSQHFVNALQVEDSSAKGVPSQPVQEDRRAPAPAPLPPPILAQVRASLLGRSVHQYQRVQERPAGEGRPQNLSVGMTRRTTLRKRDKTRDAWVITETGRTQEGRFEDHYWVDAKTLLPYRWVSRSPGTSMQWEIVEGSLRGEIKGANPAKFEQPLGETPLWFPGAPLELALSTLPLARGFTGSIQVLDPGGLASGKPFSTWRLSVPFAGPIQGLGGLKQEVEGYEVELLEDNAEKQARKSILWIESERARRVLQVETLATLSRDGDRIVQTIQTAP